jgi:AraC-like DNA-binding protein
MVRSKITGSTTPLDALELAGEAWFQRRRLLRSRDPEEVRAHLGVLRYRFELAPRDAHQLDVCINAAILGSLVFGYDRFGTPVAIQTGPTYGDYTVMFPVRERVELVTGKDSIVCGPNLAGVLSPTRDHLFRTQADSAKLHLRLSGTALTRHLAALLGAPVEAPLELAPEMSLTNGCGRKLAGYVRLVLGDFVEHGSLSWSPTTVSALEEFIVSELLLSHPHNYSEALRRLERPILPRDVKRAIEYMKAHLRSPVTVAEIVQISGLPGRTLFKHFKDSLGVSPMRYLREIRLDEARKALLRAEREEGVAAIAMQCGFDHMGRFSRDYRKRYGESPSQTLRKPRKRLVGR